MANKLHPLSAFQALYGKYLPQIDWTELKAQKPKNNVKSSALSGNENAPILNKFERVKPEYMGNGAFFFTKEGVAA